MNSTQIAISEATLVPTTVRGNSAADIRQARRAARAFADRLAPRLCPDVADTLVLVVSELVTNALRPGDGAFTLRLNAHPDAVEVAVDDTSPRWPRMRTPDVTGSDGGFGWPMVNRLARTTAVTRRGAGGKTVTAFLSR
ncbi:ATP-binding protein [Streptomyces cyaneofuscatus]|uniref:ATP-binding protein n=1 Tax=Streptomyces cyaneofuscatus TaxID=66883 RepID=UPI0038667F70|nr:ATP-binding protein [Streptomyces cyaneofuscatus]